MVFQRNSKIRARVTKIIHFWDLAKIQNSKKNQKHSEFSWFFIFFQYFSWFFMICPDLSWFLFLRFLMICVDFCWKINKNITYTQKQMENQKRFLGRQSREPRSQSPNKWDLDDKNHCRKYIIIITILFHMPGVKRYETGRL